MFFWAPPPSKKIKFYLRKLVLFPAPRFFLLTSLVTYLPPQELGVFKRQTGLLVDRVINAVHRMRRRPPIENRLDGIGGRLQVEKGGADRRLELRACPA